VGGWFTQESWTGEWADVRNGDAPLATPDFVNYPIQIVNRGAITERWAVIWQSSSTFYLVGERTGVIVTGHAAADPLAPVNPANNEVYFVIPANAWGSGWAIGDVLRFNTYGAAGSTWAVRTVTAGPASEAFDSFTAEVRGDQ
jgi:hypothetical protein